MKKNKIIVSKTKRVFDLIISIFILVILSPIILIISCLVYFLVGKPIIFSQLRPGFLSAPFRIHKFRTMIIKYDQNGNLSPDDQRLTSFGKFLRATSLDELPELINVIKGEMSLVGPRPLLMKYLELYNIEQKRRHNTLPGITGWAQINGRNILSWEEKFKHDVWYIDNWSFWLDLRILGITIWKVIKGEGISQPGHVTAEEFEGSKRG